MSGFVETHTSFVNTWECDENEHLNVQFYFKRFDEAARFHAAFAGGNLAGPLPAVRHVRYHAELRAGDMTAIRSATISSGPFAGRIVHLLENRGTGGLCATALDTPAGSVGHVAEGDLGDFPEAARPRSLDDRPEALRGKKALLDDGGLVTHRRIIQPEACGLDGEMLAQAYVGMASDGALHAWNHANFANDWLTRNGYGRVAVEMKATIVSPGRAGDALELVSVAGALGERTIRLHHEHVRLGDGMALAALDVVGLIIDLRTRRAVTSAELGEIRQAIAAG